MEPLGVLEMLLQCEVKLDGSMDRQEAVNSNRKGQVWVNIKCVKQ